MLPKPSLVLQVRLRPEEYSDTAAAEIKRSYMYLAQSVVSELDEGERAEGNLMRLNVRLMKPFWDASDPAAEQLWRASFMPWLVNATRNMSTAMHNYNTVLHPLGAGNVTYQWADFDFAPHAVLRLKVDDENRIPSEAPALCDKVRTLAAEGAFGENVARVRIPSRASIAAQEAAFEEEQARYRAALAAQDEDAEDEARPFPLKRRPKAKVRLRPTRRLLLLKTSKSLVSLSPPTWRTTPQLTRPPRLPRVPAKFSPSRCSASIIPSGTSNTPTAPSLSSILAFTKLTPARIALPLFPNLTIRASFPSLERAGRHPSGALPVCISDFSQKAVLVRRLCRCRISNAEWALPARQPGIFGNSLCHPKRVTCTSEKLARCLRPRGTSKLSKERTRKKRRRMKWAS